MLNIEELKQIYSEISDDELVRRVQSGNLTTIAHEVALKEIEEREINLSQFHLKAPSQPKLSESISILKPAIIKAIKFPLNAFLGKSALLNVSIFAFIFAYFVNKLLILFIYNFILVVPIESYAFPILYILIALRVLIFTYLSIALWRSAYNTKFNLFTIVAFGGSALFVIFVIYSTHNTLTLLDQYKPINANNVMDNSIMHSQ